ncbi:adenylate cyclase-like protein [Epithele typhae]|uniref:adenylate cyclase-like protein n=1 Tax=Epithele typhae TaxID=378194 RepID=UPI002008004D|nr:adenylate cyclase-like protein [Epithele typhae]KAH9931177.1 adenylate cyclase-like protein [Epithele typhae]
MENTSPGAGADGSHQSGSDASSARNGTSFSASLTLGHPFTNLDPFHSPSQPRRTNGHSRHELKVSPKAVPRHQNGTRDTDAGWGKSPAPQAVPRVNADAVQHEQSNTWIAPESWAVDGEPRPDKPDGSADSDGEDTQISTIIAENTYHIRIYRSDNTSHNISVSNVNLTVDDIKGHLNEKLLLEADPKAHSLIFRERGRERVLASTERPADIVRRRLLQAGYEESDGLNTIGSGDIRFLLKFIYRSAVLGIGKEMEFDDYTVVDLTGKGLNAVPPSLYLQGAAIVSLNLSRNPMLEVPLDFIQYTTSLQELRMSHMALKRVPPSVHHCKSLQRLDLACNRIGDLGDAGLADLPELSHLRLENNRIDKLPPYFYRLRQLRDLNISNNKFDHLPPSIYELRNLRHLDASFNTISEISARIGQLAELDSLTIIGNRVSRLPVEFALLKNLRFLDCRRNNITDISIVCTLPNIEQLFTDHNSTHALDVSFGPALKQLDTSHNDITQLNLIPGPLGSPYALTTLDLSHAKLSSLDDLALSQLSVLQVLDIDHNSIRSLPDSLCSLTRLKYLSCSNNHLFKLPAQLGNLQFLEVLEAHNNDLSEIPMSLWHCSSLEVLNVTSNVISTWSLPLGSIDLDVANASLLGSSISLISERKSSNCSLTESSLPALVSKLKKLYVGENSLTADSLPPLALLRELRILNLSFNNIQQLPSSFFRNLTRLRELYVSGNNISAIPTEHLQHMTKLEVLFLNGNRLQTLPREISKLTSLSVMDVGSNSLKYNINNWEFDWNWNFNTNLRYLNLSGNKRLEIKPNGTKQSQPKKKNPRLDFDPPDPAELSQLSGFSNLTQLRILGLMDVTISTQANIPEESDDRRVRTSMADVNGMAYGIADTLGLTEHLTMIDLVAPHFRGQHNEAVFAMFGRASHIASNNRLTKFLHDHFLDIFQTELYKLGRRLPGGVCDALRRSFLDLNRQLYDHLYSTNARKMSRSTSGTTILPTVKERIGASGIVLYLVDKTLYIANAGNALAVISKQGIAYLVSHKHDPFDRDETARIRQAEGWVSPKGLVNDEIDVSRSFGFFNLLPVVNAKPFTMKYDLSSADEFVIVGNRALWDHISYQTAVDIARKERDPMIAAQKLRDFAICYGAEGTTMIMIIKVSDLFNRSLPRDPQFSPEPIIPAEVYDALRKKKPITSREVSRLEDEVMAPTGHVALVFTDIRNSTHLWEVNPGMQSAMVLHNNLLRRQLRLCGGYEVKTEGDAFMCSFSTTTAAVRWCMSVQKLLLELPWPLELLECEDGKEVYDSKGRLICRGLSVRMGIHCGQPVCEPDPVTERMDYFGPMVNRAARVNAVAAGGQIMCSADVVKEINASVLGSQSPTEYTHLQPVRAVEEIREMGVQLYPIGDMKLKGLEVPEYLNVLYPVELAGRYMIDQFDAVPTASDSRVQFRVEQMRELGILCVRLETLANSQIFRPATGRKGSVASTIGGDGAAQQPTADSLLVVYQDPNLYLPVMDETSTDAQLTTVLHSLSLRIDNALSKLALLHIVKSETAVGGPDLSLRDHMLSILRPSVYPLDECAPPPSSSSVDSLGSPSSSSSDTVV